MRGHTRRKPTGRRPLPAHLPRRRVEIDISEAEQQCACGHPRTQIGEEVSEKLEYEPARFVVIETARLKVACQHCHEGVVEATAPPQAVEKSLAGEGLLAHVVVSSMSTICRCIGSKASSRARASICRGARGAAGSPMWRPR